MRGAVKSSGGHSAAPQTSQRSNATPPAASAGRQQSAPLGTPVTADATPEAVAAGAEARGLRALLWVEDQIRSVASAEELGYLCANDVPKALRCRQIFVVIDGPNRQPEIAAITSLPSVERNAPFVLWVGGVLRALRDDCGCDALRLFELGAYSAKGEPELKTYPFNSALWVPFVAPGTTSAFGGLLVTRETAWGEGDRAVAERLAKCISHAWTAIENPAHRARRRRRLSKLGVVAAVILGSVGCLPVPMTVLAPAKIIATDPTLVTAPISGLIADVMVKPNTDVEINAPLLRFNDTDRRNALEIAERTFSVASARLKRVAQAAFDSAEGRHELGLARAELALRRAERDYAREQLAETRVTAPRAGRVIFAARNKLLGRPMAVGDVMMEIVDPKSVQLEIHVATADSIVLRPTARVKVFLDSDPLNARRATLETIQYDAAQTETQQLAYHVRATFDRVQPSRASATPDAAATSTDAAQGAEHVPLRIGVRGTAQISTSSVPAAFLVFRRPLSALRQWLGL